MKPLGKRLWPRPNGLARAGRGKLPLRRLPHDTAGEVAMPVVQRDAVATVDSATDKATALVGESRGIAMRAGSACKVTVRVVKVSRGLLGVRGGSDPRSRFFRATAWQMVVHLRRLLISLCKAVQCFEHMHRRSASHSYDDRPSVIPMTRMYRLYVGTPGITGSRVAVAAWFFVRHNRGRVYRRRQFRICMTDSGPSSM